jgi:glycosyltransferase involved in cell wall biosynthesis
VIAADGDRDGIPTALLEAMASGTPVISTPVSGVPEVITSERNGLLIQPGDPVMLADALDKLLADSQLRNRLARAARANVEKRFTIDRSARQLLTLFQGGGDASFV